ncbi:disulfide bond formation protein B [Aliiruegeria sabulilitoris]|uniref:disulfide bond formation protein B n=1 Tax=Aliiruegeria sabulilitoris TaxID=1510458 RepID=UPI0008378AD4|nr:disulfide bond formation protein B [Aliiruegeria sabulilitoris]NDR58128.1 disulfide bond formation protein B [Pseudoruegeria sp. M32A2M]
MNAKILVALATVASAGSVAGAYFFQHVVGILPCHLCLLQRYPHWILAALGVVILLSGRFRLAWLGVPIALYSFGLAIYHSGVERKLWAGPSDCTGGHDLSGMSGSDLISMDFGAPVVMCDEISFSVLGLSFANINVALSAVLIGIWIMAARRA